MRIDNRVHVLILTVAVSIALAITESQSTEASPFFADIDVEEAEEAENATMTAREINQTTNGNATNQ